MFGACNSTYLVLGNYCNLSCGRCPQAPAEQQQQPAADGGSGGGGTVQAAGGPPARGRGRKLAAAAM